MDLDSWNLGSQFPSWLQTQRSLEDIVLSNTGISGEIPAWLWSMPSLGSIQLSQNQLSGEIPQLVSTRVASSTSISRPRSFPNPSYIHLSSNIEVLDLSNNLFSGWISHTFCNKNKIPNSLAVLYLQSNDLSGEIPDCWMINWPSITRINLGNNNLYGKIPAFFGVFRQSDNAGFV